MERHAAHKKSGWRVTGQHRPTGALPATWLKLWGYISLFILLSAGLGLALRAPLVRLLGLDQAPSLALPAVLLDNLTFSCAVALTALAALRGFDRRPWPSLGLPYGFRAVAELALGVLIGGGLLGALWVWDGALTTLWGQGGFTVPAIRLPAEDVLSALVFMLLVAVNEEVLVRGYPLQLLVRALGTGPAVLLTSLAFGLLHLTGDPWNAATVALDTGASGVLFALAYLKTRALWLPIGMHFANNFILFLIENPSLETINLIPPDQSQGVFAAWWVTNLPVYALAFWLMRRWRYHPDPAAERVYQRWVAPVGRQESTSIFISERP